MSTESTHSAPKVIGSHFHLPHFSLLGYARSIFADSRGAISRVVRDRAALAAIILFLIPWWALLFLRQRTDWIGSIGEIAFVIFVFWWMSRSGAAPRPEVNRPALESILAIALVLIWVEWRTITCARILPFLPSDLKCFDDWEFEIIPKLIEMTLVPFIFLRAMGYNLRSQGIAPDLRAWWIALPVLLGIGAYGLYLHHDKLLPFVQGIGNYFFAAGLPEEYLFRAFLLTRLEAWWRRPGWALFGSAAIFGLSHLAIDYLVFTNRDWRETWITVLTFQMGFGFAFGFVYQRTRNIWPVALLHAMVDAL
ncbi:MAG: lysostaphin resistance A-like protein [Acidobacteriota bacterium]